MPFNFTKLWELYNSTQERPVDPDYKWCREKAGTDFEPYALEDIYGRVVLWKLPLLQLLTLMQRPPLGRTAGTFVIIHLFGDPIDSIWSLLYKIKMTQIHAENFKDVPKKRALAMITASYDEWNKGGAAINVLWPAL